MAADFPPPAGEGAPTVAAPSAFDSHYGLELLSVSDERVEARVAVRPHHLQPAGVVHGGVVAAMAEGMASLATHRAVAADGMGAAGITNQVSFLRPLPGPTITAVARRRHRGRTTWVWDVEVADDAGRLCALVRMTIAVRPLPDAA